jgi:hypothetical protein
MSPDLLDMIIDALDHERCRRLLKIYAGLNAPLPISEVLKALAEQEQT